MVNMRRWSDEKLAKELVFAETFDFQSEHAREWLEQLRAEKIRRS